MKATQARLPKLQDPLQRWTCEDAADLYGIANWSNGYFDIAPAAELPLVLERASRLGSRAGKADYPAGAPPDHSDL